MIDKPDSPKARFVPPARKLTERVKLDPYEPVWDVRPFAIRLWDYSWKTALAFLLLFLFLGAGVALSRRLFFVNTESPDGNPPAEIGKGPPNEWFFRRRVRPSDIDSPWPFTASYVDLYCRCEVDMTISSSPSKRAAIECNGSLYSIHNAEEEKGVRDIQEIVKKGSPRIDVAQLKFQLLNDCPCFDGEQ